jgi:tetratricopeptide (TPR) repeat protein
VTSIHEILTTAVEHHRGGRLSQAEQHYRQVLAANPRQPDALQLLGVIAHQVGKHEAAVELISQAIALSGAQPTYHNNLGEAYRALGRLQEAVACYEQALRIAPTYAEANNNLGTVRKDQGRTDEAAAQYRRAIELMPAYAAAHNNLAIIDQEQGRAAAAEAGYKQAIRLDPNFADAHNNLGTLYREQRRWFDAEACHRRAISLQPGDSRFHNDLGLVLQANGRCEESKVCYERAIELKPGDAEAHNNLGNVFSDLKRDAESIACYRRALELRPTFAAAHYNLGNAFKTFARFDDAAASYGEALRCDPDYADAYNNLGNLLRFLDRGHESIPHLERAIELRPDLADAHFNLGFHRLMVGDFAGGWPEYEWRLRQGGLLAPRHAEHPRWRGESLEGRTILLHAEQGLGDTIQFIRYAASLKALEARVVVECQPLLAPLLARSPGVDQCLAQGEPLPKFDAQSPLMSVPGVLQTAADSIPNQVPYVVPEAKLVAAWQSEFAGSLGFKIGVVWQGNPEFKADRFRSFPASLFAGLAEVPGVQLYSLQKGPGRQQLTSALPALPIVDLADRLHDFDHTAAAMQSLDLVITSDTSPAHLAGALGVPVWLILGMGSDWRWLLDREDCPWYPSMRLFRQRELGNWAEVFERVRLALANHLRLKSSF